MKFNLFWKIYASMLLAFLAIALSISYLISVQQISRIEKNELETRKMLVDLLSKEIEARYYENKWPHESLSRLSKQEVTLFWWVVRDNDGLIYLADKSSVMGTLASDHYPQLAAMAGKEQLSVSHDRNQAILVKHLDTGQTRWSFWYGFSLKEVAERKKELVLLVATVSISSVVVLGIILFFATRHTMKPVKDLISGAAIIGSGDLAHRIKVESEDELGQLANAFNRMADDLSDAQEEMVRKEKLAILGQLSGSVGHELRNPLGVMNNAVYFLKTVLAEADETTREYLEMIKHEIDNSQRIITDLLDFARTKTPQTKGVTARELIDESLGKCSFPQNVAVQVELPGALPAISVDPLQMGQVFQNLITNAVQAMPQGGALKIAARRVRSEESGVRSTKEFASHLTPHASLDVDFVEISVSDTGEGIAPENMKKLFQPLFTTKPKGIGLGLVVCRNLTEANGGRIDVESEVGKGTTFAVMLPVERGES